MHWLTCALVLGTVSPPAVADEYFVAPEGRPDQRGTQQSPWDIASVFAGRQNIEPGSTVYLAGGVYRHPERRRDAGAYVLGLRGAPDQPIHVRPVPGQRVTIDGGLTTQNPQFVWVWDLEFTVSETRDWDRRVDQPGSHIDDPDRPAGGLTITSAVECKFINLVIHNNPSTGVSFWRGALDCELHGCLIYQNGWIGPDRYHGPGIYTQNDQGQKWITDCILWGNYSTTIQAYGSRNAFVNNFRIVGNIAFAPRREGGRQRVLIGGGRPSEGIVVRENILYEVPLQIGYTAPYNYDCVVRDNLVVHAPLRIQGYRQVDEGNNRVVSVEEMRADAPAQVLLRVSRYDEHRAHLAIFNWQQAAVVEAELGEFLNLGDRYRVQSALDYFGAPVAEGRFDGTAIRIPLAAIPETGGGEFGAYVVLRTP